MKRAVILHGTDAEPEGAWRGWLRDKLVGAGYEVWLPDLPGKHTPDRQVYNDFLFGQDWDFTDSLVIGHSSGAVEVLNLLMDERCPKVKLAVVVSGWAGGLPTQFEEGNTQFANLFPAEGFDFKLIESRADKIAFLHSDNDPYCPLEQAEYLAEELGAPLTLIHDGGHLNSEAGFDELPQLWEIIEPEL